MSNESIPSESLQNETEVPSCSAAPLEGAAISSVRPKRRNRWRQLGIVFAGVLLAYLVAAYFILPVVWIRYERRHLQLDGFPRITHTHSDIPGDPLNVALVGTETEVKKLMLKAQWEPADPLTLRSCLEIAAGTVFRRPDETAPVSNLYLWGRKQDLAFEQPVGNDPRQRHHVRFWRSDLLDGDGRPIWVGSATYDRRVGFSHTTGQITHHIAPDVDAERDHLIHDLQKTGGLSEVYTIDSFQTTREGRNGGGDSWRTDGNLWVGVIAVNP